VSGTTKLTATSYEMVPGTNYELRIATSYEMVPGTNYGTN